MRTWHSSAPTAVMPNAPSPAAARLPGTRLVFLRGAQIARCRLVIPLARPRPHTHSLTPTPTPPLKRAQHIILPSPQNAIPDKQQPQPQQHLRRRQQQNTINTARTRTGSRSSFRANVSAMLPCPFPCPACPILPSLPSLPSLPYVLAPCAHSSSYTLTRSLTLVTYSLTHYVTHSRTHALTHSPTPPICTYTHTPTPARSPCSGDSRRRILLGCTTACGRLRRKLDLTLACMPPGLDVVRADRQQI